MKRHEFIILMYLCLFSIMKRYNVMKKFFLCLLSLGLLLMSCKQNEKIYSDATLVDYDDFKEIIELKAETIAGFDSLFLAPTHLCAYDSMLITINKRSDKRILVFNVNTEKKVAEHISVGQGPGEMLLPRIVGNDDSKILISDLIKSTVLEYSMEDFFKSGELQYTKFISLQKPISGEVRLLKDRLIGDVSRNTSFLFYEFNSEGEVVDSIGRYPEANWEITDVEKKNVYSFSFTTNQQDRIAVCYNWTDLIDIYDREGNLLNRIHGPRYFASHFEEFNDGKVNSSSRVKGETRDAYFSPVHVGDEFWVLFSGKSEDEDGYNILAEQIFVFGWDGTPRKIFKLDKGVLAFTVNEKMRKIYGISNSPDYHILTFSY